MGTSDIKLTIIPGACFHGTPHTIRLVCQWPSCVCRCDLVISGNEFREKRTTPVRSYNRPPPGFRFKTKPNGGVLPSDDPVPKTKKINLRRVICRICNMEKRCWRLWWTAIAVSVPPLRDDWKPRFRWKTGVLNQTLGKAPVTSKKCHWFLRSKTKHG